MENLNKAVSHGLSWFSSCPTRIFSASLLPLPHLYMLGHPRTQVIHSEVFFINTHLRSSHSLLSPQMYLYTDSQQIYVPGPEFSTVLEQLSNRMSISKINTFSSCFPTRAFSFHFPKSINDSSSDTQFLILYQIHYSLTGSIFRTHRNPNLLRHQHDQLCLGLESVPPNWPLFLSSHPAISSQLNSQSVALKMSDKSHHSTKSHPEGK